MNTTLQISDDANERIQQFERYLDDELGPHKSRMVDMLQRKGRRLMFDLNHLRDYKRELWTGILTDPIEFISALETAIKNIAISLQDIGMHGDLSEAEFYAGFSGALPQHEVNPRSMTASFIGKLVLIEGIVTRCSLVRPKVRKSVHYAKDTKSFWFQEYRDATMISSELPVSAVYPTEDPDGNRLQTEYGFCRYVDFQTITIQEMPERSPAGQLPRSVDVVLNADLVDSVKPGDRVRIYGVYRSLGGVGSGSTNAVFRCDYLNESINFSTVVIANHLIQLIKSVYSRPISEMDIQAIKKISKRKDAVDLLASSLAPSIYGHELIKKAILLQLLGGTEKNLTNGTHIRGDINILMVGDPSTAKSQLLRFVLKMAPLAIATTGRGSSGVGLTAAVVTDKDTGERRLEAGAMVLADRGTVCIDEFDKMSDIDRVAIHEVMEQQTVTIAKAGIHTSLNARCSVIAAANPLYGQYNDSLSPAANTALPDSLISRFDLVFIVLDEVNPALDRIISSHVLRMHRYIPAGLEEGEPIVDLMTTLSMDDNGNDVEDDSPFEKHHPLLGAARQQRGIKTILRVPFLKKYIYFAKNRIKPVLTEEASDCIVEVYADFRDKARQLSEESKAKVFPVTPRTLEGLIRLSTAHAKARLSNRVEKKDALAAAELVKYSIFREIKKSSTEEPKAKKPRTDADGSDGESDADGEASARRKAMPLRKAKHADRTYGETDDDDVDLDAVTPSANRRQPRKSQGSQKSASSVVTGGQSDNLSGLLSAAEIADGSSNAPAVKRTLAADRYEAFRGRLHEVRTRLASGIDCISLDELIPELNGDFGAPFERWEIDAAIERMQDANHLMLAEEMVYFIG